MSPIHLLCIVGSLALLPLTNGNGNIGNYHPSHSNNNYNQFGYNNIPGGNSRGIVIGPSGPQPQPYANPGTPQATLYKPAVQYPSAQAQAYQQPATYTPNVQPQAYNPPIQTNTYLSNNPLPQKTSYNQNNPYAPSYEYNPQNLFRPVQTPTQKTDQNYNPGRQFAPVITNAYIPPTTYKRKDDVDNKDAFFSVTNPLSNKKDAISSYQPQNNFVDPSHFIIPSDDKYDMVHKIFGGLDQGSGPKFAGGSSRSLNLSPGYKNLDDGFKSLDNNLYSQRPDRKRDFNLGFFDDDKPSSFGDRKQDVKSPSSFESPKQGFSNAASYGQQNPLLQAPTAKPAIYESPLKQEDVYKNSGYDSKQTRSSSTPYQNGLQTSYRSGNGYQDSQGYSDQGRQDFNNAYNLKGDDSDVKVSSSQGGSSQSSFHPSPSQQSSSLIGAYQGVNVMGAPKPGVGGPAPNIFTNQSPKPLFTSFTPNKPLSLDQFRSKNLLGDKDFGKTNYDQTRPTSGSILGSDLYQKANFGRNSFLSNTPSQFNYDKGGSGYNNVLGNTQTFGNGYDDVRGNSQGYSKTFDNGNVKTGGTNNFGGFNTYNSDSTFGGGKDFGTTNTVGGAIGGNKGGYANQDGFSKSHQGSDSFKNSGGYSDGDSYSNEYGYSDGDSVGNQYSNQDQNQQDYKNGYQNQKQTDNQRSFSNTDGYNNAYSDGQKYDVTDGYTDKINYNNKDSDTRQTQYTTNDGYHKGVADVGDAISGNPVNPYGGLGGSVNDGLQSNANYKPFDVNGPVFGGSFIQ